MKFKFVGIIETTRLRDGGFMVTRGDGFFVRTKTVFEMDTMKKHFTPADCEALNLVDPDRTGRLCRTII